VLVHYVSFDGIAAEFNLASGASQPEQTAEGAVLSLSADGTLMSLRPTYHGLQLNYLEIRTLPERSLKMRLPHDDMVSSTAFSPDGRQLYSVAGSFCNVWELPGLLHVGQTDHPSTASGEAQESGDPENIQATQKKPEARVWYVASDPRGQFYGLTTRDGSLAIHDMTTGQEVPGLFQHAMGGWAKAHDVRSIGWSKTGRHVAVSSAHPLAFIEVNAVTRRNGPACHPQSPLLGLNMMHTFEFQHEMVLENGILFDSSESRFFVAAAERAFPVARMDGTSTVEARSRVWDVKTGSLLCFAEYTINFGGHWLNHPADDALLLYVDGYGIRVFEWDSLKEVGLENRTRSITENAEPAGFEPPAGLDIEGSGGLRVSRACTVYDRYVVLEVSGHQYTVGARRSSSLLLIDIEELTGPDGPAKPRLVDGLSERASRLIGCLKDHVVFLDHDYCICTWDLAVGLASLKRHFHLPKDWLEPGFLDMCEVNQQGTVVCPRKGEVGVIRGGIKL
jgi:hypothetical protein